jgi:antitoxin (DNA-binding transcriptional repressor) of toxin-antitoxin stability system
MNMKTITIHDAKTNLSKYIAAAKNGEKVYIGGFGKAEVVLTKISADEGNSAKKHSFSIAKGKITEKPGSFSATTDNNIADLMRTGL